MKTVFQIAAVAFALAFFMGDFKVGGHQVSMGLVDLVTDADARVGRPMTPVSAAGVARRTTRRVIRRGAYIAAVPAGCAYGTYYGYSLYYCGGTYYQKSGSGYVVVYF